MIQSNHATGQKDELHHSVYEEIETAVKGLKKHKSPEIDEITGEMIQAVGEKVIEELHAICNRIWKEGSVLEDWAQSVFITRDAPEALQS